MPSFKDRERCIAFNVLKEAVTLQPEDNLVVFVGENHLISVAQEIVTLLGKGEEFMNYKRITVGRDLPEISEEQKIEYLKNIALSNIIYDEGGDAKTPIPFKHREEDKLRMQAYELGYLKKFSFSDALGVELEKLGIIFKKDDFIPEDLSGPDYLSEHLRKQGGRLECLPLSFLQGSLAYYQSQK